ncbi:MAG: NAD-dependent succinate-semialdehyde dehydrogenase [Pseudomonadota bacterium]
MDIATSQHSVRKTRCYIDGQWVGNGDTPVINPATGETIAHVPYLGEAETNQAINAASVAFKTWSAELAKTRSQVLRRWFDLIVEHADEVAAILTEEQGKPLAEAKGEVLYAASFVEFYAEEAKRINGETIPSPFTDGRLVVIRQPVGVVAAITPWNFPAAMITRKVAPAIAAGCTTVVKPAPDTPLTALALAALADKAGLPAGVFNVVTGDAPAIGNAMCDSSDVRAMTFTGSTPIGKLLMRQCADTVKKMGLELGGNAPFIVFDDADLDEAVKGAMISKFRNVGQTCVCANRLFVQAGVYDAFAEKLAAAVSDMVVGPGADAGVTHGPLINAAAVAKVSDHVEDAISKGAKVAIGGEPHALGGNFYQPTVLTDVTTDMKITREETFGPVAPLYKFEDEQEVIDLANATEFGLAAYFYTRDIGRVWRVAEALEYGMVAINSGILSTEVVPFGGVKESGIGREGSSHGVDEFTELKYMMMGGI